MSTSLRSSADGSQAILAVNGADKVVIGSQGIEPGSFKPGAIAPADLAQKLTLGTATATTSGTSVDFTGIPSWVKRVTVTVSGVSCSGASGALFQVGAGSVVTTGYKGVMSNPGSTYNLTAGLLLTNNFTAASLLYGMVVFTKVNGNEWVFNSWVATDATYGTSVCAGGITLGGSLDRVRLTTINGTDTFDAGSINLLYE